MVAEAFHCTDYESEHVVDTAIFSKLTIQSADEKVITTILTGQKELHIGGCVKLVMEKQAIMKNVNVRLEPSGSAHTITLFAEVN